MPISRALLTALTLLALTLAACGADPPPPTPAPGDLNLFGTPSGTASAGLTPNPADQPGATAPPDLAPTATPTPFGLPTPTPCINDAQFVADQTIPDLTQVTPGTYLDKQWVIRNTGTCPFSADYRLVFLEGTAMTPKLEHAIFPALPATDALIRVEMTAPDVPGEYTGRWELRDPTGQRFGTVLFIKIIVVDPAAAQP